MTVKDLIKRLEQYDDNRTAVFNDSFDSQLFKVEDCKFSLVKNEDGKYIGQFVVLSGEYEYE